MSERESRTFPLAKHGSACEWRASDTPGSPGMISAHGIVFNRYSQDLGGFVEQVAPEAVRRVMGDQVVSVFNHDPNQIVGRSGANMTYSADETGVRYTVDLPQTSVARDLAELVKQGIVDGSSFAFRVAQDSWGTTDQGFPLRTITGLARLYDLSPVVYAAYPSTSEGTSAVALRSLAEWSGQDIREIRSLAESGHLIDVIRAKKAEPPSEPPAAPFDPSALIAEHRRLLDRAAAYRTV